MSNLLSGLSSLAYQGTNAPNPPNVTRQKRDPNFQDWQNFSLMDEWLNTDTQEAWILVSLAGNRAMWVQFTGGTGSLLDLTGDTGTAVPSAGSIKIAGGTNITTVASGSTVTANLDTTITGISSITTNALTVSSLGRGVVQSSSSGVLSSSEGTNGQVLISSSTGAPTWANITAGSNITITNGANSIEIASTGGGGGGLTAASIIGAYSDSNLSNSASEFYSGIFNLAKSTAALTSAAPVAGVINNLYITVQLNTSTSDVDLSLNVNGVDTALSITVPALTTGVFSDLINAVSIAQGDLVCFHSTTSTVGTLQGDLTAAFSATGGSGSCGLTLIQTQNVTGVAAVNFTTGITATYRNYLLLSDNVSCPTATSGDTLLVQLSTNAGASYITSGYCDVTGAQLGLNIGSGPANATGIVSSTATLYNLTSGSGYVFSTAPVALFDVTSTGAGSISGTYKTANVTVNAIRINMTGNKVFSGNFSLYGYSK